MLQKKFPIKPKVINFSSEDSQDTDPSINSSIDLADDNEENTVAKKFNQLRETMNKYFMANPELAEEIRFQPHPALEDKDDFAPIQQPPVQQENEEVKKEPLKRGASLILDNKASKTARPGDDLKIPNEEAQTLSRSSSKLWASFSREMNKGPKNTKAPALSQITHMLNLFKADFEKPSVLDNTMTSPKGIIGSPKRVPTLYTTTTTDKPLDFRIQSAKSAKEMKGGKKDGKGKKDDQNTEENEEDGVSYYSVRKKKHLQLKHKIREQEEANKQQKKKDEDDRQRMSKERDHKNVMDTLADLDEELNRNKTTQSSKQQTLIMNDKGDIITRPKKRRNSTKVSNIFDRLTKDTSTRNNEAEEHAARFDRNGRTYTSDIAESLHNEMKIHGSTEHFKRMANAKINNYKREFREKMSKQKPLPTDGLKFTKDDNKYFNTFLPDFDRVANISNKDAVFIPNEVIRGSEEWRENIENDILLKFNKITNGSLFEFWKEAKDLNQ